MVLTRNMKRTLEEQNDTPAPETPAFKALRTGYDSKKKVQNLTAAFFLTKTPVEFNNDEEKEEQIFKQLQTKICPGLSEDRAEYYNSIETYLYEYIARLFLRVTDGGKTKMDVSQKLLPFFLSKELTGNFIALHSYVNKHIIDDDADFFNYDDETAEFFSTVKNWFDVVLAMYSDVEHSEEDARSGVFKAERLQDGKTWRLSLNEEYDSNEKA
jgi:hypothetical protein